MLFVNIVADPIDINFMYSRFKNHSHGALTFFFGNVRDINNNLSVSGMRYDSFVTLAKKTMEEICWEAKKTWGDEIDIFVAHRTGALNVGETSVAVGVSAVHRKEALEACRYIIDELKKRVPIWKEEVYKDGGRCWVEGNELQ